MEAAPTGEWVRYEPARTDPSAGGDRWLGVLGLQSFRILLWLALVTVGVLVGIGLAIRGRVFWVDIATASVLAVVLLLVTRRPEWFKALAWVVLAALVLDALDGLNPAVPRPVTPTHVLMPMLVLYGALLCDLAITAAALVAVLGMCALTWARYTPLAAEDAMMLSHVALATSISGLTALAIWMHHRRLMQGLRQQAEELRGELDTNNRLAAVIFHDIANPLTVLSGTLELARLDGTVGNNQLTQMGRMTDRIASIVGTARATGAGRLDSEPREAVTVDRLLEDLREVFGPRLAAKRQSLALAAGAGLAVTTVPGVLLNSVLGNLLSNAIKFSPPGSAIELRADREADALRIEVRDQGAGFPPELLERGGGRPGVSRPGTEGERGHGHGLAIAALYTGKLGGRLEVMNRSGGGAAVSVVLPA